MPAHILDSEEQIQHLRARVRDSVDRAATVMRELLEGQPSMVALASMKFEDLGFHPVEDRRLNLIEQVNQTFTYLVSLAAAEDILVRHSGSAPIHLNLGTTAGYDLVSPSQDVVAEVFAAVRRTNNRKLARDVIRVDRSEARHKYVFFHCPGEAPGVSHLERFPEVHLIALSSEAVWRS
ncbi:MAG: hypothetical protein ACJ76Y_27405 [Thermoanaerobaculia bacterium]